ncbi:MAG: hypothetical protein MUC36_21550 [Planctomycetes bacterium]|jgi:hypothetical protein|nr:hypothetical protein [Planctomycetota bacterium]
MKHLTLLTLPLLSLATLPAQELATIGTFVDLDGNPVADATITFATSPPAVFDTFAPAQLLVATTDASGKFRVKLRQGTAYSVWALGPRQGARRLRSKVEEGVVAGSVLALRAATGQDAGTLQIDGLAGLGNGPFTAEVHTPALHGPTFRVVVPADGAVVLPDLPVGDYKVRLFGPDQRLVIGQLDRSADRATIANLRPTAIEVVDRHGKPVAGARVGMLANLFAHESALQFTRRHHGGVVEAPPTDADGRTTIPHAVDGGPLVAWSDTAAALLSTRGPQRIEAGVLMDATDAANDQPLRLVLLDAPSLRGRLHQDGVALMDRGIAVRTTIVCKSQGAAATTTQWFTQVHTARTDQNGEFGFAAMPGPIESLQLLLDTGDDVPSLALVRTEVPATPLKFDVARWPLATLQLHGDGAIPPALVRFLLWPAEPALQQLDPIVLIGDRSGRARARLEPGAWFLLATDGDSYAAEVIEVQGQEPFTVQPQLCPLARMSGRVVDGDGKPVAGAVFFPGGWSAQNPDLRTPLARQLFAHHHRVNGGLIPAARTDADGRFVVRLLTVKGCTTNGQLFGRGQARVEFQPAENVEIRLLD